MTRSGFLERRREVRLHRFGLGLGVAVALLLHGILLWGPRISYRPVLEEATVRRVLRVRPYRPPPPPPPRPEVPPPKPAAGAPAPAPPVPRPAPKPVQPREIAVSPPEPPAAVRAEPRPGPAVPSRRREPEAPKPARAVREARPEPVSRDEWKAVLAQLEARARELGARAAAGPAAEAAGAPGEGETGAGGAEGFLDPRIRVTVVSYPPTAIETDHPPIPYPDLRVRRRELKKGICRVWYRVWTDERGNIVRRQLKAPSTPQERRIYEPFVKAVTESVESWPFEARRAEVHVDVLFEIE